MVHFRHSIQANTFSYADLYILGASKYITKFREVENQIYSLAWKPASNRYSSKYSLNYIVKCLCSFTSPTIIALKILI